MTLDAADLKDLTSALSDRLYLQVAGWHLYLGDAGLAETLAIECSALLDQGPAVCARRALEAVQVPIGAGSSRLPSKDKTAISVAGSMPWIVALRMSPVSS